MLVSVRVSFELETVDTEAVMSRSALLIAEAISVKSEPVSATLISADFVPEFTVKL